MSLYQQSVVGAISSSTLHGTVQAGNKRKWLPHHRETIRHLYVPDTNAGTTVILTPHDVGTTLVLDCTTLDSGEHVTLTLPQSLQCHEGEITIYVNGPLGASGSSMPNVIVNCDASYDRINASVTIEHMTKNSDAVNNVVAGAAGSVTQVTLTNAVNFGTRLVFSKIGTIWWIRGVVISSNAGTSLTTSP